MNDNFSPLSHFFDSLLFVWEYDDWISTVTSAIWPRPTSPASSSTYPLLSLCLLSVPEICLAPFYCRTFALNFCTGLTWFMRTPLQTVAWGSLPQDTFPTAQGPHQVYIIASHNSSQFSWSHFACFTICRNIYLHGDLMPLFSQDCKLSEDRDPASFTCICILLLAQFWGPTRQSRNTFEWICKLGSCKDNVQKNLSANMSKTPSINHFSVEFKQRGTKERWESVMVTAGHSQGQKFKSCSPWLAECTAAQSER